MPDSETGAAPAEPLIVGVGASAGGLEALTTLVEHADPDTPVAWVLVQHLSPDHKSFFPEILQRRTRLKVAHATHLMRLQAGTVYVIEPNTQIRIQDGHIEAETFRRRPTAPASSIDHLFRSIAQQCGRRCAVIVLSGSGSDGTEGARIVREVGGFVLAESPATAAFDSMPSSVIRAGLADGVLRPEDMAATIARFATQRLGETTTEAKSAGSMRRLVELLTSESGINFEMFKPEGLERRITRRMARLGLETADLYGELLASDPEELDGLARDLLVGVTSFFRDPEAFWTLQEQLRDYVTDSSRQTYRIWICGCSTGEEAYTVAMIMDDILADAGHGQRFKLFATDINEAAITAAARGVYSMTDVSSVPSHMLGRYFFQDDRGQYRVRGFLRESMLFSRHDATSEPPFSRLDLVTCRNLLIYLRPTLQQAVMDRFDFGLSQGGLLMLGSGESPHGDDWLTLNSKWRLFRSQGSSRRPAISSMTTRRTLSTPATSRMSELGSLHRAVTRTHLPPHVVVTRNLELRYRSGELRDLISLPEGPISTDLRRMVSSTLAALFSTAVDRLSDSASDQDLVHTDVQVETKTQVVRFDLRARRAGDPESESAHFVFFFEGVTEPLNEDARPAGIIQEDIRDRMEMLEAQLTQSEHRLQSTIEELESSNEELQATNEELLASNEELQSVNEELQSVNEELHTVNRDHQIKIDELTVARSEFEELLQTIDVGVLRLDDKLAVQRVNGTMSTLSSISKTDVGRPLSDLRAQVGDVSSLEMCLAAVEQEDPVMRTSWAERGSVVLRAKAVRTAGQVKGVILTATDVSDLHTTAIAGTRLISTLQRVPLPVAVENDGGVIVYLNRAFAGYLGREARWLEGGRLDALAADPAAVNEVRAKALSGALHAGTLDITFGQDVIVSVPFVAGAAPTGAGAPGILWHLDVPIPTTQHRTDRLGLVSGNQEALTLSPHAAALLGSKPGRAIFEEALSRFEPHHCDAVRAAAERCLTQLGPVLLDLSAPDLGELRFSLAADASRDGGITGALWTRD